MDILLVSVSELDMNEIGGKIEGLANGEWAKKALSRKRAQGRKGARHRKNTGDVHQNINLLTKS